MSTSVISLRLNGDESSLLSRAANFHGLSVAKYIKRSAKRLAEDEIDLAIAEDANKSGAMRSFDNIKREYLGR
jgi:uncharacterized protein (DUF1778 family)